MPLSISPLLPISIGSIMVIACLIGAFFNLRRKRIVDDLPTSKTQGVFIGQVELKGTAESEKPLKSILGSVNCVQYSWKVEEHWSRTVTETHTDSKGHAQTRTRTESGWKTVAGGGESIPFYLKDDTGVIRIVPEGARIEAKQTFNVTCTPADPLYYGKGPAGAISNSTHKRRFQETAIPLHEMLYIAGQSREREDIVAAEIARDKNAGLFLISVRSEKQISRGYGIWYWLCVISGFLVSLGGSWVWAATIETNQGLSLHPFLFMIGGYLLVFILGWIWSTYNSLINLHHRVKQSWSEVDVQLKRRNDLIPNLVSAVEGYKNYEKETLNIIVEIRKQVQVAPTRETGADFKGLAPLISVIIEKLPELKANSSFLKLHQALVDTEQRIALARDYFNDTATFYNTRLQIVPDRFVAVMAGLHQRSLMGASDFERAPVEVQLVD